MENRITEIGTLTSSARQPLLHMWRVEILAGARALRRHSHLSFEITQVVAGCGTYTVGERSYPMAPGDIFVFASNEQHCITDAGAEGLAIVNLQFEPRLLWGSHADRFTEERAGFCFSHGKDFENRIKGEKATPLQAFFAQIEADLTEKPTEYALSVRSYLNLLLITLIRDFGYTGGGAELTRSQLHALRRVLEYIDTHLEGDLTLAALADAAGLSPNYLSAVFHRISGITLWDYISTKRIDKAIRLLTDERELTVLAVASLCGFNNTANFNKTFKKITGITPTEYRTGGYALY